MCASPLPLFFKVIHTHTHPRTRTEDTETISISLPLHTLSLCSMGSRFGWSTLIAEGHSLFLAPCGRRKKKSKLSHSSNQHLPESSPRELPFFFCHVLFPLSLSIYDIFFVISLTNNSCVPNSQEGAVISYLSAVSYTQKLLWTCVLCRNQSPQLQLAGNAAKYNTAEMHWHRPWDQTWQLSLQPSPASSLNAFHR